MDKFTPLSDGLGDDANSRPSGGNFEREEPVTRIASLSGSVGLQKAAVAFGCAIGTKITELQSTVNDDLKRAGLR